MANLDWEGRLRIQEIICEDYVALRRWSLVVHNLVRSPVDVIRIQDMLGRSEYAEAVLETLQFTDRNLSQVLEVLRRPRLNAVAEIIARDHVSTQRIQERSPEVTDTLQGYNLVEVQKTERIWQAISNSMNNSIVTHQGNIGGIFRSYEILKLEKVHNENLTRRYEKRQEEVLRETSDVHERRLFHGTKLENVNNILEHGLDERYGDRGMFGAGIYFAEHSSKSNQYVFGQAGCLWHHDTSCYSCERKMLICAVTLGTSFIRDKAARNTPHPPPEYHSLTGIPGRDLQYPEYIVYRGEQANPEYVVTYRIVE